MPCVENRGTQLPATTAPVVEDAGLAFPADTAPPPDPHGSGSAPRAPPSLDTGAACRPD